MRLATQGGTQSPYHTALSVRTPKAMTAADRRAPTPRALQPAPHNAFREWAKGDIEDTLHGRFEALVNACAERPAVITRTERVDYRTLNARANRVAHAIVARRGTAAEPVALLFQQGLSAIVATLAVLKAGKFYVPLELDRSSGNAARLLKDARARLLVTDTRNFAAARELCGGTIDLLDLERIDAAVPDHDLGLEVSPDALAYVYYTSGTTGTPKGVTDSHRNVLHNIMRYTNRLHICADDRLTLLQPFSFSGAVSSLFCALLNGACVFPIGFRDEAPGAIAEWLEESRVTIYHSVPAVFRTLVAEGRSFPSVRLIRLEGDQASPRDVGLYRKHFGPDCLLVNGLGTTETGIACQFFIDHTTALEDGRVPVGYPADDIEIRVLRDGGTGLASVGQIGEIAVVSRYLSPGYWHNPPLTERAFARDPLGEPGRMYRTGDLGRLRADGCLEHLGRSDTRVKVHGRWVALGDVESALMKLDAVRVAVVAARENAAADSHLIAYIIPENGGAPASALRRRLSADLPPHMIPTRYVSLESLPLSDNGKVDRKALPLPSRSRPILEQAYVAPGSLLQQRIAQVWEEVLEVRPVGVHDNFFDLGGDSLDVTRMVDRLGHVLGREIPLSAIVEARDVQALADILFEHNADLQFPLLNVQPGGTKPPLFFLHGDYLSGGFYCLELARHLGPDQPLYALPPYGLDGRRVPESYEEMATLHLQTLRAFRPLGPYRLGGTCNGGLVAFEMARQLLQSGETVERLILVGSSFLSARFRRLKNAITAARKMLRVSASLARFRPVHPLRATQARRDRLRDTYLRIDRRYVPAPYAHPITLFWAEDDPEPAAEAAQRWKRVTPEVDLHVIPGTHLASLTDGIPLLAEHVKRCLG